VLHVTDNLGLTGIDFVSIEVLPFVAPTATDTLTPTDTPTPSPTATPTATLTESDSSTTVSESGTPDTYTLALGTQPTADGLVSVTGNAESDQDKPGVILDYAEDGSIVGMEILDASKHMSNPSSVFLAHTLYRQRKNLRSGFFPLA